MLALAALTGAAGCGGSSGVAPTTKCVLDSECKGALVCIQGYCVGKCSSSKDCGGNRCIKTTEGPTCQAPETVVCHYNSECTRPLICSGDLQCRNQCQTSDDCATGQVCTTMSKLCADPAVDKNYDATTNEFKGGNAAFGAGIDVPDGATNGDAADAPSGDAPATDGGAGADGAADGAAGTGVGIASACPGTPLTLFSKIATGDTSTGYGSGVGARLATEMVIFDGFTGLDDVADGGVDAGGADAGAMPPYVNRIDVQHFDLTGKAKGAAQRLALVGGKPDSRLADTLQLHDVAVAPTGEIGLVYGAGNADASGIYLALLDPAAATILQTIQLQSVGGTRYGRQTHLQWENGQFVASWVSYIAATDSSYLNIARFLKDGTPSGSSNSIPTDSISRVRSVDYDQASVAFVDDVYAISWESSGGDVPGLTFLGPDGNQVGGALYLPYGGSNVGSSQFTVVGATTKGFVALYNGQVPQGDAAAPTEYATLATFVAPPPADGGVGATVTLPGMAAVRDQSGARASSDALGAGFAILTNDGKASFAYFMDDGTKHVGPSQVIQESAGADPNDQVRVMNLGGSYAVSLYSRAERLTRVAVSGCPAK